MIDQHIYRFKWNFTEEIGHKEADKQAGGREKKRCLGCKRKIIGGFLQQSRLDEKKSDGDNDEYGHHQNTQYDSRKEQS